MVYDINTSMLHVTADIHITNSHHFEHQTALLKSVADWDAELSGKYFYDAKRKEEIYVVKV
jgi:hypothetical protein